MKSDWSFNYNHRYIVSISSNHHPANNDIPEAQYDPLCKAASHKPAAEQQKDTEVEGAVIAEKQAE